MALLRPVPNFRIEGALPVIHPAPPTGARRPAAPPARHSVPGSCARGRYTPSDHRPCRPSRGPRVWWLNGRRLTGSTTRPAHASGNVLQLLRRGAALRRAQRLDSGGMVTASKRERGSIPFPRPVLRSRSGPQTRAARPPCKLPLPAASEVMRAGRPGLGKRRPLRADIEGQLSSQHLRRIARPVQAVVAGRGRVSASLPRVATSAARVQPGEAIDRVTVFKSGQTTIS